MLRALYQQGKEEGNNKVLLLFEKTADQKENVRCSAVQSADKNTRR
jgi:hypothetical protein